MQRDQAVDEIARLLTRSTSTFKDKVVAEMSYVQTEVLEQGVLLPWFLIKENTGASVKISANTETLALPTDFIQEVEDGALYYQLTTGGWKQLRREDWGKITDFGEWELIGETGDPKYYDIVGESYYFRPVPTKDFLLKQFYYAKQADISGTYGDANGTVENGWLKNAADLVIAETGLRVASLILRDPAMVQLFGPLRQAAFDNLLRRDTIMRETNKQRSMEG